MRPNSGEPYPAPPPNAVPVACPEPGEESSACPDGGNLVVQVGLDIPGVNGSGGHAVVWRCNNSGNECGYYQKCGDKGISGPFTTVEGALEGGDCRFDRDWETPGTRSCVCVPPPDESCDWY